MGDLLQGYHPNNFWRLNLENCFMNKNELTNITTELPPGFSRSALFELSHRQINPTGSAYSAYKMAFHTLNTMGEPTVLRLEQRQAPAQDLPVSPGRIVFNELDGGGQHFYCFGGVATITPSERTVNIEFSDGRRFQLDVPISTVKVLSPVPVLDMLSTFDQDLATTLDAQLARLRAEWMGTDREFDRRLAQLKPETLFAATLSLEFERLQTSRPPTHKDEIAVWKGKVNNLFKWMKETGKIQIPTLSIRELMFQGA